MLPKLFGLLLLCLSGAIAVAAVTHEKSLAPLRDDDEDDRGRPFDRLPLLSVVTSPLTSRAYELRSFVLDFGSPTWQRALVLRGAGEIGRNDLQDGLAAPVAEGEEAAPVAVRSDGGMKAGSSTQASFKTRSGKHNFLLEGLISAGHHGQVYRAALVSSTSSSELDGSRSFVLKRLFPGRKEARRSGLREIFFGKQLKKSRRFARFVESWTSTTTTTTTSGEKATGDIDIAEGELFLVFADEGVSLQTLLFDFSAAAASSSAPSSSSPPSSSPGSSSSAAPSVLLSEGSVFFGRLHLQPEAGALVVRTIVRHLLEGLSELHATGSIHRDVKSANILVQVDGKGGLQVKLCDLGSAVAFGVPGLYDEQSPPSQQEETQDYSPPEVRLSDSPLFPFHPLYPFAYDSWSAGVVLLEMVFGIPAPALFTMDASDGAGSGHGGSSSSSSSSREEAILNAKVASGLLSEDEAKRQRYLLGLKRWCLFSSPQEGEGDEPVGCTLDAFRSRLRRRLWKRHFEVVGAKQATADARQKKEIDGKAVAAIFNGATSDVATRKPIAGALPPAASTTTAISSASKALALLREEGSSLLTPLGLVLSPRSGDTQQEVSMSTALIEADGSVMPAAVAAATRNGLALPPPVVEAAALQEARTQHLALLFDSLAKALVVSDGAPAALASDSIDTAGSAEPPPSAFAEGCSASTSEGDSDTDASCTISRPFPLLGEAGEELLWRLLAFAPAGRITADDALRHPYFATAAAEMKGDSSDSDSRDGRNNDARDEVEVHEALAEECEMQSAPDEVAEEE